MDTASMGPDEYIRGLAAASLAEDDATGWWDTLYAAAGDGITEIPWDRGGPHRLLASWHGAAHDAAEVTPVSDGAVHDSVEVAGRGGTVRDSVDVAAVSGGAVCDSVEVAAGRGGAASDSVDVVAGRAGAVRDSVEIAAGPAARGTAVVVGAGLGGDAEFLAARGWSTTAFDISATAVRTARERFPNSTVNYVVADLFDPPAAFAGGFDLVLESMTVQALPRDYRERAVAAVRALVRPGGTLLVIAAAIEEGEQAEEGPPWPLTRAELELFGAEGLAPVAVEEFDDNGMHRWRAEFRAA